MRLLSGTPVSPATYAPPISQPELSVQLNRLPRRQRLQSQSYQRRDRRDASAVRDKLGELGALLVRVGISIAMLQ